MRAEQLVKIKVPASSANLGPGFDTLAAALNIYMTLEVSESGAGEPQVEAGGLDLPTDSSNLCVAAFAALRPTEGLRFRIASEIPIGSGLGSSGAAIAAGLVAANRLYKLNVSDGELLEKAAEIEGHPDNVAASLHGGFVVCAADGQRFGDFPEAIGIDPPDDLEAVLAIPEEKLPTEAARSALPDQVPLVEATFNTAHAALLVLGLERGDRRLIAAGLKDRIHQPRRAPLYPRSIELMRDAEQLGALGATISGAGPAVLFWTVREETRRVLDGLAPRVEGWATLRAVGFAAQGATTTG